MDSVDPLIDPTPQPVKSFDEFFTELRAAVDDAVAKRLAADKAGRIASEARLAAEAATATARQLQEEFARVTSSFIDGSDTGRVRVS
jgi:hypothetical protein